MRRWRVYIGFVVAYLLLELLAMLFCLPLEDRFPSGWAMLRHHNEIPAPLLGLYVTGVFVLRFPIGSLLSLIEGQPFRQWELFSVVPNAILAACLYNWVRRRLKRTE